MLKSTRDTASGGRKLTFSLPADEVGAVSVVGNFNDWTPGVHPLVKRGAKKSVSVVVPADYIAVFRYLEEGGRWFDEPEATFVDSGASVLLPPEPKPAKASKKKAASVAAQAEEKVAEAAAVVEEVVTKVVRKAKGKAKDAEKAAKASKAKD